MSPEKGYEFYLKALEKYQDERLFARWIHGYQTSMEFSEFKKKAAGTVRQAAVPHRELSEAETYEKVKNILRKE